MKPAPHVLGYLAAALLFTAAILTIATGGVALWQPITLLASSALFAGLAIYAHRRSKRGTA